MSKVQGVVGIDELAKAVMSELSDYQKNVTAGIKKEAKKVGKEAAETLKQTSPEGVRGRYKQGWTTKTESGENVVSVIVHNKTDYQLTHLLEKSHALPQGGRTTAQVHIKPAEEKAIQDFEQAVEKVIENAGH